jgi:hypothetical protein
MIPAQVPALHCTLLQDANAIAGLQNTIAVPIAHKNTPTSSRNRISNSPRYDLQFNKNRTKLNHRSTILHS